jgi:hypothetical protein
MASGRMRNSENPVVSSIGVPPSIDNVDSHYIPGILFLKTFR